MSIGRHGIPRTLPATGNDRNIHTLSITGSNSQIQAVVYFAQHLDAGILKQAVRLSLDAEPILGCFFVDDPKQPFWQRFDNPDEITWFDARDCKDQSEAVDTFLRSPFATEGQQLNVCLISSPEGDALCVKLNHACSDAGGLKEYLRLLAELYDRLQEAPAYEPEPNIQGRRDLKHFFDALGIQDPLALFDPQAQHSFAAWVFPFHGTEEKEMQFSVHRLEQDALERIISYGKERQATVNTILLTAFLRAMFKLTQPEVGREMEISYTMDLRTPSRNRSKQTICNLSTNIDPRIARIAGEPFDETLQRMRKSLAEVIESQAALASAVTLQMIEAMDYSKFLGIFAAYRQQMLEIGKCTPMLSNIGVISPLYFGQIPADDVLVFGPTLSAPGFMLGVSTYGKRLTFEVSYCEPAHRKEEVEALIGFMEQELRAL